ncbi:hypothetical protein EC968_005915 [Mortierella alpina]|nr:hypothetical protein EC968_005915 [Mortierella alpina]
MLVNAAQSHFKFERFAQSPAGSFDSLAPLKSDHVMRKSRFYETIEIAEGSASPAHPTRHAKRKSEGAISLEHLQKSLSGAGVANVNAFLEKNKSSQVGDGRMVGVPSGPFGGKKSIFVEDSLVVSIFDIGAKCDRDYHCTVNDYGSFERAESTMIVGGSQNTLYNPQHVPARPFSNPEYSYFGCSPFQKLAVFSPVTPPRRSLLSDLLSSQGSQSRLEQNANRRRMLKSMRRYSVDASEMDFSVSRPSSRFKHLEGIPSEEEGTSTSTSTMLADGGRQGFSSTPTVRYLRNPCHAAVKTKLLPSAYRGAHVRRGGAAADDETPDYFGAEDRVW